MRLISKSGILKTFPNGDSLAKVKFKCKYFDFIVERNEIGQVEYLCIINKRETIIALIEDDKLINSQRFPIRVFNKSFEKSDDCLLYGVYDIEKGIIFKSDLEPTINGKGNPVIVKDVNAKIYEEYDAETEKLINKSICIDGKQYKISNLREDPQQESI